ncbi:MAG: hypothetical protein RIF33_22430 [Cyclobacteriaceae bacterium]
MPADNTRPIITTLLVTADMSAEETFQNSTLRPIIKMKHDLFIDYLLDYLAAKKNPLSSLGREKGILYLESVFQQDRNLRSELRGVVLSHLTTEEYHQYVDIKSEMNKRIINIIKNRMVDHIDLLSQGRLASV